MSDDIFASLSQILSHGPTEEDILRLEAEAREAQDESDFMRPAPQAHAPDSSHVPDQAAAAASSAAATSFLSQDGMLKYESDIAGMGVASEKFTPLLSTTFGLSGLISHVQMNESELMPFIQAPLRYPCIRAICNFGCVEVPEFQRLVADGLVDMSSDSKAERARAKKQKRAGAKPRKTQGNGKCFNSSIMFWVFSEMHRSVYKIRLFRTGTFGLPGTKPEMIRDIIDVIRDHFIPVLRDIILAHNRASPRVIGGPDPAQMSLTSIMSIMKNYKWKRILPSGAIMDLRAISTKINADKLADSSSRQLPFPFIYVRYGVMDTKLSIKFSTPSTDRPDKTVLVNIFRSGKINILGAHDSASTKKICEYLIAILGDDVIVSSYSAADELELSDPEAEYTDNDDL